jgi:glycosyltransferase involved in cell wall biosynthesis
MKFSIVIPTFKRVGYLEQALNSINKQTYSNYEVAVINDCIDDKAAIDALCSKFEKVKVIHHEVSKGGNAARNTGINNTDGDIIAFLDDDDLWLPNKLQEHANVHIKNPDAGLVYSDCEFFWEDDSSKNTIANRGLPANVVAAMQNGDFCPISTSLVTVSRTAVAQCGLFDESLISFQDWDMWFRISKKFKFLHIPRVLIKFRQHTGVRTSKSIDKRLAGLGQVVKKWSPTVDMKTFEKKFTRRTYYFYVCDLILNGEKAKAFSNSFELLKPAIINANSIKRFFKLTAAIFWPGIIYNES